MLSHDVGVSAVFVFAALMVSQGGLRSQSPAYDLVIRGGRVVDGTGNPWFLADVGVKGDTIVAVGPHLDAAGTRTIGASGLVVAPGFIDVEFCRPVLTL